MPSTFNKTVQKGDKGRDVKLAQEWLCYHGFSTAVDGVFGEKGTESNRNGAHVS